MRHPPPASMDIVATFMDVEAAPLEVVAASMEVVAADFESGALRDPCFVPPYRPRSFPSVGLNVSKNGGLESSQSTPTTPDLAGG